MTPPVFLIVYFVLLSVLAQHPFEALTILSIFLVFKILR